MDRGTRTEAVRDLNRAIALSSGSATIEMYYNLGKALLLNRELDKAIQTFTKVVELAPNHGLAYANRGVARKDKDEYFKAVEDFRKALTLLKKPSRIEQVRRLLEETTALMAQASQTTATRPSTAVLPELEPPYEFDGRFW
jgi:tetratricopeptide (TPR) repeat protein